MNKLSTRRIAGLAACATLGAAVATQIVAPPEAGAFIGTVTVRTDVSWGGVECLVYLYVDRDYSGLDRTNVGYHKGLECNPAHAMVKIEHASPGDMVGIAPSMSANLWISCQVYINGVLDYSATAAAGDGTDTLNCLRIVK